MSGGLSRNPG